MGRKCVASRDTPYYVKVATARLVHVLQTL